MDLSTKYLGLELPHPLVVGASPLVDDLDLVKRVEDAGAAAIVMHSLFEEQLTMEQVAMHRHVDLHADAFGEALSYLPEPIDYALGPDQYLDQIRRIKQTVSIPVIGSLNGSTDHGWLEHARLIEEAGADALELNLFDLSTDPDDTGLHVEQRALEMVQHAARGTKLPLAVKLSPFYSSLPAFAQQLVGAGARGLVLFNRFFQPDIDPEALEHVPALSYSDASELLLRLRWIGILADRIDASLAASGGVHGSDGVIKAVMTGADAVQMVSCLLQRGPEYLREVLRGLEEWLEEHEYHSLRQMKGSMSLARCPDPNAYRRGNYVRILQSWKLRVDAGSA